MPIALSLLLVMADGILINLAYEVFHVSIGLNKIQLFVLLIPVEIINLLFIARFNKILAAAALIAATGVTFLLLKFILSLPEIPPS